VSVISNKKDALRFGLVDFSTPLSVLLAIYFINTLVGMLFVELQN